MSLSLGIEGKQYVSLPLSLAPSLSPEDSLSPEKESLWDCP